MKICKGCPYHYEEIDWCMVGEESIPDNMRKKCDRKSVKIGMRIIKMISRLLLRFAGISPRTRNMVIKIFVFSRYQELFRY